MCQISVIRHSDAQVRLDRIKTALSAFSADQNIGVASSAPLRIPNVNRFQFTAHTQAERASAVQKMARIGMDVMVLDDVPADEVADYQHDRGFHMIIGCNS